MIIWVRIKWGHEPILCLFRLKAHRLVFPSRGTREMWRHREEVRVQPCHQEVPGVHLQRLWGEREQLHAPQSLHGQVQQRPKGYDCTIAGGNVNYTDCLKENENTCVTLFRCNSQEEEHPNKEEKHWLHCKPLNLKAISLCSHLYLYLYFMFFQLDCIFLVLLNLCSCLQVQFLLFFLDFLWQKTRVCVLLQFQPFTHYTATLHFTFTCSPRAAGCFIW